MKTVYLDHNATTFVKPAVREVMQETSALAGNPSSIHRAGRQARRLVEDARETLKKALNGGDRDIVVFTSGATEANNMVLAGCGMERVIASTIEHPSVAQAMPDAEKLPVNKDGVIDLSALENMLKGNTRQTLISVMLVNNETGVIQPVEKVSALARRYGALVHTDAVQAFGRMPLDIQSLGVDFLTLSGHKIGGPQGVGALIIANCAPLSPLLKGGNQEKNMRAGTENISGIAGFAKAIEIADVVAFSSLAALRDKIESALPSEAVIFGKGASRVANTSLFAIPGLDAETQLIALDLAGICVSNGSACASGTVKPSPVVLAMGAPALAMSALRVSLGWNSTAEDVDFFIEKWQECYARIKGKQHDA